MLSSVEENCTFYASYAIPMEKQWVRNVMSTPVEISYNACDESAISVNSTDSNRLLGFIHHTFPQGAVLVCVIVISSMVKVLFRNLHSFSERFRSPYSSSSSSLIFLFFLNVITCRG